MYHLGIDVGGTNIKVALVKEVNAKARILRKASFPFNKVDCETLCKNISEAAGKLLEEEGLSVKDLTSVGAGLPGCVDPTGNILVHAFNMGYHNVPFKAVLQKYYPELPIFLTNDANAAALAEMSGGAFEGKKNALLLTLGTGLGGGIIINGKLFNGGQNRGAEIAHMPFKKGGDPCTCGMTGCAEVYTCAPWLKRQGQERIGSEYADAKKIVDAARDGHPVALEIFNEYVDNLATYTAGLCSLFDPEIVAFGGGVSGAGDILYKPLEELVEARNFNRAHYTVVPAKQGNDAGALGAALLYSDSLK